MTPVFARPWAESLRRRPLALAVAASLALHGAALAAAHFLMQGEPPGLLRAQTIAVVMVEPDAAADRQAAPQAAPAPAPAKPVIDPPVARTPKTERPAAPPAAKAPAAARPVPTRAAPRPAPVKPLTPDPTRKVVEAPSAFAALTPPRRPEPPAPRQTAGEAAPVPAPIKPAAPAVPAEPRQARLADGPATPPAYGRPGLANPAPRYPWLARQRGEQGRVVVRVAVDAGGRATQVQVARSSGSGRLDRAAMAAIRHWRFAPARRAGQAVAGAVEVPVTFRLSDQ